MNDLLNAIGALAEVCGLMRDEFIKNGYTREEALHMTTAYLVATATAKPGKSKPDEN